MHCIVGSKCDLSSNENVSFCLVQCSNVDHRGGKLIQLHSITVMGKLVMFCCISGGYKLISENVIAQHPKKDLLVAS